MRQTISLTFQHNGRALFWSLSLAVIASLTLYVYFLCASVFAAVERNEIVRHVSALSSEVALLDADFVRAQARVTLDEAHNRGFKEVASPKYLGSAEQNSSVVAFNNR